VQACDSAACRQHDSERRYVGADDEWPDRPGNLLALVFIPEGGASNVAETLMDEKLEIAVWSSLDSNGYLSERGDAIRQRDESAGGGGTVLENHSAYQAVGTSGRRKRHGIEFTLLTAFELDDGHSRPSVDS
jgi:hypothetical protein